MTGNNHNTPNPYHAKPRVKPKADLTPIGRSNNGAGDKPQVNRFDRIDRHIHQLKWLVAYQPGAVCRAARVVPISSWMATVAKRLRACDFCRPAGRKRLAKKEGARLARQSAGIGTSRKVAQFTAAEAAEKRTEITVCVEPQAAPGRCGEPRRVGCSCGQLPSELPASFSHMLNGASHKK